MVRLLQIGYTFSRELHQLINLFIIAHFLNYSLVFGCGKTNENG